MKKTSSKPKPKKRESTPRPYNAGTWTESEYFGKIRSGLRRIFQFWKPMQIALKNASRPSQSENKRLKTEYQCAHCKEWFPRKEIEVDHVQQAGSLKSFDDIVPFIKKLAIENVDGFQLLCKNLKNSKGEIIREGCHNKKTKLDRENK